MENKNDITELRQLLFETIRDVRANKIKPDEARIVSQVATVLVESAKAEVKYMEVTGDAKSLGFFPSGNQLPAPPKE